MLFRSTSQLEKTKRGPSPGPASGLAGRWRQALNGALRWGRAHYREHISVAGREHMSPVDCVDGQAIRNSDSLVEALSATTGGEDETGQAKEFDDMVVIHPVLDGRLKDEARK